MIVSIAMKQAIENGAKIIVAPGFLQAKAMETVAKETLMLNLHSLMVGL